MDVSRDERVPVDETLGSIDKMLYDATGVLETCRRHLYHYRGILNGWQKRASALEEAYYMERQKNNNSSQKYQLLYSQHEHTLQDLRALSARYRQLQKDFESAQTTILGQAAVTYEYERRMASDLPSDQKEILESRIRQLENENPKLSNALASRADKVMTSENDASEEVGGDSDGGEEIEHSAEAQHTTKRSRSADSEWEDKAMQTKRPSKRGRKKKSGA